MRTHSRRTWAIRGFALVVIAAAMAFTLTRGGSSHRPAAAKPRASAGGCALPAHWYPAPLAGTTISPASAQQRDVLLKHFGLAAEPGQVAVVKDAHGTMIAALFAVTDNAGGLLKALDATRPKGAKVDRPLAGVARVASPNGAFEYGGKGCAVYLAVGNRRSVDALMTAMWSR